LRYYNPGLPEIDLNISIAQEFNYGNKNVLPGPCLLRLMRNIRGSSIWTRGWPNWKILVYLDIY